MNELTHLDLFSGIGGFALAAQRAGFRTVGFSEVEPYACRLLAERFPGVPNLGDARNRDAFAGVGRVTVLTGGFPCQPWSVAGKQRGAADDRHLWPAMLGVIETVRPAWIIGENVFGLVSMGLDHVLTDLEAAGYSTQAFVVPACAVDARHRRDRLWVVAHTECLRRGQPATPFAAAQEPLFAQEREKGTAWTRPSCATLAHADSNRLQGERFPDIIKCANGSFREGRETPGSGNSAGSDFCWWLPEPNVGRVADGIPNRSHRLKGLGNAIVPQVAEPFFHWIAQIERGEIA